MADTNPADNVEQSKGNVIVVDLGKKNRKQVKRLRNGHGKLMDRVTEVLAELKADGTAHSGDTVVVVVERKSKNMKFPYKF